MILPLIVLVIGLAATMIPRTLEHESGLMEYVLAAKC